MGEEIKKTERKELTPLKIANLKVTMLEGEILGLEQNLKRLNKSVKELKNKCEDLENQLAAKGAAFDDLLQDPDIEEIF